MSESKTDAGAGREAAIAEAERLLRYREGELHAEPLDDLAARRLIDAAVARAEAVDGVGAAGDIRRNTRGRRAAVALAAVAAVALAALGAVLLRPPGDRALGAAPQGASAAVAATRTVVLLASAASTRGGARVAPGAVIRTGEALAAVAGDLAIGIGPEIALLAEGGAEFRLAHADDGEIEVSLERGAVLASVTPGRIGSPFAIATSAGRVLVKGTVFRVIADGRGASVEVYRGTVSLEDGAGARRLREGRSAALGAPGDAAIPAERLRAGLEIAYGLGELAAEGSAPVAIASTPDGAAVSLDGRRLGATPLAFLARPGRRLLEVAADGNAIVREVIDLRAGQPTERRFDLAPAAAPLGDGAAAPVATPAPPSSAPRTAAELLDDAQRHRAARRWQEAVTAYRALVDRHGDSPEARVALVALGAIELDHLGEPARAHSRFARYLAAQPSGSLAPEAAWGDARALRRLGRGDDEIAALRRIVASYPGSLQADGARARLAELGER